MLSNSWSNSLDEVLLLKIGFQWTCWFQLNSVVGGTNINETLVGVFLQSQATIVPESEPLATNNPCIGCLISTPHWKAVFISFDPD